MNPYRIRKKTEFYSSGIHLSKADEKIANVNTATKITGTLRPLERINPLENLLIWSFFKHYGWWPGRILDREELDGPLDPPEDPTRWIRWFGDNKYSEVKVDGMASFHEFSRYFSQARFNRNSKYRLAVIEALQEATLRSGTHFDNVEEAVKWALQDFLPGGYRKILPKVKVDVKETQDKFDPRKIVNPRNFESEDCDNSCPYLSEKIKRRNKAVEHVKNKLLQMEDICMRCGSQINEVEHPFFIGGLCSLCKDEYIDAILSATQSFCVICARNENVAQCEKETCNRGFCHECVLVLSGKDLTKKRKIGWTCFLCMKQKLQGLLSRRDGWMNKFQEFITSGTTYIPIRKDCPARRRKLRVLSLFDGISVGLLALKALNFEVECYYAAEIDHHAIVISHANHPEISHIGDVCAINNEQLLEWGPFDLLLGGSPCNDLAIVNPRRKGLWSDDGTGWLFFEFYRILSSCSVMAAEHQQPFFWLYENVCRMDVKTKGTISRYLQVNPVLLDAAKLSAASRPRLFWGNLPGMMRPVLPGPADKLTLQECLENGRIALTNKVGTITTNCDTVSNKAAQEKYEVIDSSHSQKDVLWLCEIERAFGFPDHYTDKSNISCTNRRAVLGRSWSVPVIRHLLEPLREFYLK